MEKLTYERFAEIIKDKEICEFCEDCGNDEECLNCKKVNPATVNELRAFWMELSALVKAQDEGLVQSMSCIGCRYDQTSSLREHEAKCMRCIRNRYPDDHYTRAEAEAALGGGGDGCIDTH